MRFLFFPAFFDRPERIRFADQEENENIELFLRQHFITNIPWIVASIIGIIAPVILIEQKFYKDFLINQKIPIEVSTTLIVLWYMFIASFVIGKILYWYFNIYIVTNTHLVDIALLNLLSKTVTEIRLEDVQSANAKVAGIFGSLFNFGNVIIETAAERQNISFLNVPRPDVVRERIQDLQALEEESGVN